MLVHSRVRQVLHAFVWLAFLSTPLYAQTVDDGVMLPKQALLTGDRYTHETWDQYWEGTLKRANKNIGTVTTKTNVWSANYGLSDRLNILANVPYVWTGASQGVLHGIEGLQDITLAAKYSFVERSSTSFGALRAIAVVSAGIPMTDYNPELPPLITAELLKLLFPAAVEEITLKAAEQRQAALLGGKASASDIAAGLALGQAVAAVFVARAGADGMRTAGGSPALWQALADAAVARGEIPWKSMDIPARPPMLPLFGSVRAWMMTPADIVKERPGPPPSTSSGLMARELAEVRQHVDRGTREELAIANKWADGPSTPTPPGHWNFIAAPHIRSADFSEVRAARAFALLNMALHDAAVGCWDTKYFYFNPRPSHMDPDLKSVIGLPNFPSYTSGHSTFSGSAAEVLSYLFPSVTAEFEAQSREASISRLYGGILASFNGCRDDAVRVHHHEGGTPGATLSWLANIVRTTICAERCDGWPCDES